MIAFRNAAEASGKTRHNPLNSEITH